MADGPTIKAIPTKYKGFRFRSRLEARWAVFLDKLGVAWEYEREGYDLGDGLRYLPDFYLPEMGVWLEVKGVPMEPYDRTWQLAAALANQMDEHVYVFCGQFTHADNCMGYEFFGAEDETTGFRPTPSWWFQCPVCKKWQLGRSVAELPCMCVEYSPASQPKLVEAILKAKEARFEHGESG